jgi:hypothetical protein
MEKIDQILDSLYDRVIEPMEAKKQLLDLFAVSCQCDACKQDRIDSNYRKYIELNKNVIGYD